MPICTICQRRTVPQGPRAGHQHIPGRLVATNLGTPAKREEDLNICGGCLKGLQVLHERGLLIRMDPAILWLGKVEP